jgi:general secretion pathway protein B
MTCGQTQGIETLRRRKRARVPLVPENPHDAGTMPRPPPAVQYFGQSGETAAHRSTMSFILDALKKSENSRLREDHPAIFDAQAAALRRQGLPRWSIALMALLGLNLLILVYALWRPSEPPAAVPTVQPELTAATRSDAASPDTSNRTPSKSTPSKSTPSKSTTASAAAQTAAAPVRSMAAPPSAAPRSTPPALPVLTEESPTLPSRDDLLAAGAAIPEANLNMHVYDASPALRFVLLNGQRLREGEVSREGLRVEQILPEGVLLSAGGTSFMLSIN